MYTAFASALQGVLQRGDIGRVLLHVKGSSHEHAEGLRAPSEPRVSRFRAAAIVTLLQIFMLRIQVLATLQAAPAFCQGWGSRDRDRALSGQRHHVRHTQPSHAFSFVSTSVPYLHGFTPWHVSTLAARAARF